MALDPTSWPGGGGGTGSGLPTQWTDGGHGDVIASVDLNSRTAIEIDGTPTQTARLFRVLSDDGSEFGIESDGSGGIGVVTMFNTNGAEIDLLANGDIQLVAAALVKLRTPTLIVRGANAAPADGDLIASDFALWLDDTPGATKLMVKAKDSLDAVRTAAIALA